MGEEKNSLTKEINLKTSTMSDLVPWESKVLGLSAGSVHHVQEEGG